MNSRLYSIFFLIMVKTRMSCELQSSSNPINNQLTIYSRSGHIIQKYSAGTKFITLPKSAEIASIVVMNSDNVIVSFIYTPELDMATALRKTVVSVTKDNQTVTGQIISLNPDDVTLITNNEVTRIRNYDRVTASISEDFSHPHLILEKIDKPITVSYLLSSISWTCIGTALIDSVKNIMHLRLAGNISNGTDSSIHADTILVSGDIYQYRGRQNVHSESYTPRALMAAQPMTSEKVSGNPLEDYVKFNVGNRIIHNQDIAELGTWSFPVVKLYIHQTNEQDKVRFGYRFIAPGFIPACSINAYSVKADQSIDSYLGSSEINESQQNDEVDIILGSSTLLQCQSSIVISSDIGIHDEATAKQYNLPLDSNHEWHVIIEDLKVDITNHSTQAAILVLKHYVENKLLLQTKCQSYKKRDKGWIEWYFEISPGTASEPRKEQFVCQITTAGYH
jgi:hypothetical protein